MRMICNSEIITQGQQAVQEGRTGGTDRRTPARDVAEGVRILTGVPCAFSFVAYRKETS
jgi:hypothetical protein